MALFNLRNEPRREITEQIAGLVFAGLFIWADYALVKWTGIPKDAGDVVFGMLFGVFGLATLIMLFFLMLFFTHAIGEIVCGWLKRFGLDPRPTKRYR